MLNVKIESMISSSFIKGGPKLYGKLKWIMSYHPLIDMGDYKEEDITHVKHATVEIFLKSLIVLK